MLMAALLVCISHFRITDDLHDNDKLLALKGLLHRLPNLDLLK